MKNKRIALMMALLMIAVAMFGIVVSISLIQDEKTADKTIVSEEAIDCDVTTIYEIEYRVTYSDGSTEIISKEVSKDEYEQAVDLLDQ